MNRRIKGGGGGKGGQKRRKAKFSIHYICFWKLARAAITTILPANNQLFLWHCMAVSQALTAANVPSNGQ